MGCSSFEEYNNKNNNYKQKSQYPYMLPPHGVLAAHQTRTNFVRVGDLPDIITHAKFEINWYKMCLWRSVEVSCFSTTTADAINTAKPCLWLWNTGVAYSSIGLTQTLKARIGVKASREIKHLRIELTLTLAHTIFCLMWVWNVRRYSIATPRSMTSSTTGRQTLFKSRN